MDAYLSRASSDIFDLVILPYHEIRAPVQRTRNAELGLESRSGGATMWRCDYGAALGELRHDLVNN